MFKHTLGENILVPIRIHCKSWQTNQKLPTKKRNAGLSWNQISLHFSKLNPYPSFLLHFSLNPPFPNTHRTNKQTTSHGKACIVESRFLGRLLSKSQKTCSGGFSSKEELVVEELVVPSPWTEPSWRIEVRLMKTRAGSQVCFSEAGVIFQHHNYCELLLQKW